MITSEEIEKLASLARIKVTPEEKEQLGKEIDSILAYVTQINEAAVSTGASDEPVAGNVKNILRDDAFVHESGIHTENILAGAPDTEKGYIKVKKIL